MCPDITMNATLDFMKNHCEVDELAGKIGVDEIDMYISDVEGNDLTVLRSMSEFLERKAIKTIQCEVVPDDMPSPFVGITNYEHQFDEILLNHYKKVASGWTHLEPGRFDGVPDGYYFKDVMYALRSQQAN